MGKIIYESLQPFPYPYSFSLPSSSLTTLPSSYLLLLFCSSLYSYFPLNLPPSVSTFPSQPSPSLLFLFPFNPLPYLSTSLPSPSFSFPLPHPSLLSAVTLSLFFHFFFPLSFHFPPPFFSFFPPFSFTFSFPLSFPFLSFSFPFPSPFLPLFPLSRPLLLLWVFDLYSFIHPW